MNEGEKSGGKRAVEKKHAQREAERKRNATGEDWRAEWLREVDALGDPGEHVAEWHLWMGRLAMKILKATARDVGLPFEKLRSDAIKQIEQLTKAIGNAEMAEELRGLYEAMRQGDAAQEPRRDASLPEEATNFS
jgi:hypothetical protein